MSKFSRVVQYIVLAFGLVLLLLSFLLENSILAFAGLGLTFWGVLLIFVRTEVYVESNLLPATTVFMTLALDQLLAELRFHGKTVYLPPKSVEELRAGRMIISSSGQIPPSLIREARSENSMFLKNSKSICIAQPGAGLANLFEDKLGTSFTKVDENYLNRKLRKLLVEDLELMDDLEIGRKTQEIRVRMSNTVYRDMCKEVRKLSSTCNSIGCPLCSAIACVLTRTTGKPIAVEKIELMKNDRIIEAFYQIMEE